MISCGQSLLYNNIFPKHKDRLAKRMSELVVSVAKVEIPSWRNHFDVVVAVSPCPVLPGHDRMANYETRLLTLIPCRWRMTMERTWTSP